MGTYRSSPPSDRPVTASGGRQCHSFGNGQHLSLNTRHVFHWQRGRSQNYLAERTQASDSRKIRLPSFPLESLRKATTQNSPDIFDQLAVPSQQAKPQNTPEMSLTMSRRALCRPCRQPDADKSNTSNDSATDSSNGLGCAR